MSDPPIILIIAIDDSKHVDIITSIINNDSITEIPKRDDILDNSRISRIDTKYYTAVVQFSPLHSPTSCIKNIVQRIEAVVLLLDHSVDSYAKELEVWESVVRYANADVNILLSKVSVPEDQKQTVDAWCIKNECELIELEYNGNPISDSVSDSNEKFGIERLVEALQTHHWSNLVPKKAKPGRHCSNDSIAVPEFEVLSRFPCVVPTNTPIETPPEYVTDSESSYSMEKLDNLFQTLKSMKLNISSLSGTEKLDRAEEVVKTFWSAIGGDMDEFSDSDHEII